MDDMYFCGGCFQMVEAGGDSGCTCFDDEHYDEDLADEMRNENG